MYADFDLVIPDGLDAAFAALRSGGEGREVMPLAGGTNLLVDLRARRARADRLVGLGEVAALRGIDAANGTIRIGAGTTVSDLLREPVIADAGGGLAAAAGEFAGQMVRNAATVAGNICYGSPAADLVPPLLALDAEVTLANGAGERTVALDEFFVDYRKTLCAPDELVTAISWPRPASGDRHRFYKLARRRGDAITVVGVAVSLGIEEGRCRRVRIALGAVAPTCFRAHAAEALVEGAAPDPDRFDEAARQAVEESSPIDDVRASAAYRRHSVQVLVRRLLTEAAEAANEGGTP